MYRGSESRGAGLRIFRRGKVGFGYTQDFSPTGLGKMVERALEACKLADVQAFPAPGAHGDIPDLGLVDQDVRGSSLEEDKERLSRVIRQARDTHHHISSIKKMELRRGWRRIHVMDSEGLDVSYEKTIFTLLAGVVASRDGVAEVGWEADSSLTLSGLNWGNIGKVAALKAVSKLGAKRAVTGRRPVILDREVVAQIISFLGQALSAEAVLKKKSLYAGRVGTRQAADAVTLVDDPTMPGALGAAPIDDEGQVTSRKVLVARGVLRGYLHSLKTASQMDEVPTGNGFRQSFTVPPRPSPGNFYLEPGRGQVEEWRRSEAGAILVDEIMGAHTINPVSGDFSVGAAGFEGRRRRPVRGATIAGNIRDLFLKVVEVGGDLRFFGNIGAPSLLLEELDIAG